MAGNGRVNLPLILALAGGKTVAEAADATGLSERTIFRRLEDADFRRRVSQARGDMLARAVGRLADVSARAVKTLEALLEAEGEFVRLNAAKAILETGNRLRES